MLVLLISILLKNKELLLCAHLAKLAFVEELFLILALVTFRSFFLLIPFMSQPQHFERFQKIKEDEQ